MKTFALFLFGLVALTQGRVAEYNGATSRIVNGEDADLGDIPFQVSLQTNSNFHFCGGSIVNQYWVVTAAHCVVNTSPSTVNVLVGSISLSHPYRSHKAVKIIVHETYAPSESNKDDIALIQVETPFEFSEIVGPVPLPELHFKVKTNSSAVVSGWGGLLSPGSASPDRLQKAKIFIADPDYCYKVMQERSRIIYPTNVCANDPSTRRGQCNGDSGGPLTVDGVLTGIVSWSIKDPYCASTVYPGVYTRVSEYVDWIHEHAQ